MKQKFFRLLADLRFAIFILLLISFCSIIGTVIEQDQPIETYKLNYPLTNQVFGFLSWDRILALGLDHVYQTWWFLTLICLFGISLISCTFLQQFPSLKIARRCQFFRTTVQFYRLKISTILNNLSFNKIVSRIKKNQYSIFQQKNIVYCYKGLIGRIAPIIVHFSMILILLGTIIGSLFGFKAQEIVPKSESFHIQNILKNQNKVWLTWISNNQNNQPLTDGIVIIIDNLEGYCSMYNESGKFLGNIELNESVKFQRPITLLEIISSTGLQIKTDPGIPIIYLGFFLLMGSTLISYITYSQIWIIQKNHQIFIGGNTNRAVFEFELEFFKFLK